MSKWEVHVKRGSETVTVDFGGVSYQLPPNEAMSMAVSLLRASQHAATNKETK